MQPRCPRLILAKQVLPNPSITTGAYCVVVECKDLGSLAQCGYMPGSNTGIKHTNILEIRRDTSILCYFHRTSSTTWHPHTSVCYITLESSLDYFTRITTSLTDCYQLRLHSPCVAHKSTDSIAGSTVLYCGGIGRNVRNSAWIRYTPPHYDNPKHVWTPENGQPPWTPEYVVAP